jgi:hypothetical protein
MRKRGGRVCGGVEDDAERFIRFDPRFDFVSPVRVARFVKIVEIERPLLLFSLEPVENLRDFILHVPVEFEQKRSFGLLDEFNAGFMVNHRRFDWNEPAGDFHKTETPREFVLFLEHLRKLFHGSHVDGRLLDGKPSATFPREGFASDSFPFPDRST